MSNWKLGFVFVGIAAAAGAAEPAPRGECIGEDGPQKSFSAPRTLSRERLQQFGARFRPDLKALAGPVVEKAPPVPLAARTGEGAVRPSAAGPDGAGSTPAGTRETAAPARSGGPADTVELNTTGDIMVTSGYGRGIWSGRRARCAWGQGSCPSGATAQDAYAIRFTTSELAKQLPFDIAQAWMQVEDYWTWSRNWNFEVVPEDPNNAFFPDRTNVLTSKAFDSSTVYPTKSPTAPNSVYNKAAKIDFDPDVPYPAASRFAVNDRTMDDCFDRADGPLATSTSNWIECSNGACFPTTGLVQIQTQRATIPPAAGTGPAMVWRLPVVPGQPLDCTGTAPNVLRTFRDYIDDAAMLWFVPDSDVRLSASYDVSGGRSAGFFARASYDFAANNLLNYYTIELDGAANQIVVRASSSPTPLATQPLPATTGTLMVEVSGWHPVTINIRINGSPIPTVTDSAIPSPTEPRPYQMDVTLGHIFGMYFPSAAAAGTLDQFRVDRNADLFVVADFPDGEAAYLLAEAWEEGREFFNTFFYDPTVPGWAQSATVCSANPGCVDCTRIRNTMISLGVRDSNPNPGEDSVFQVNNAMTNLYLGCCDCLEDSFDCSPALGYIDECSGNFTQLFRPRYEPGKHINVNIGFTNERAPNTRSGWINPRVEFFWIICENEPSLLQTCLSTPCSDIFGDPTNGWCGAFVSGMGPLSGGGIPGMNESTVTDYDSPPDGLPDGPLMLSYVTPQDYTVRNPSPQNTAREFIVLAWELGYTLDGDDNFDDPNPDDYPYDRFVQRRFVVSGCTQSLPHNLDRNSLLMVRQSASCTGTQHYAQWRPRTLPLDAQTPFNLHEISTRAQLVTDLGGCGTCNPWPTTATFPGIVNTSTCLTPAAVTNDVNYYSLHQADECTMASRADQ